MWCEGSDRRDIPRSVTIWPKQYLCPVLQGAPTAIWEPVMASISLPYDGEGLAEARTARDRITERNCIVAV
jgi:hypothetical protein